MGKDFNERVRERAYFLYLNRINNGMYGDAQQDWNNAYREELVEEKINEEAYLHFLNHGDYPLLNWLTARKEIHDRISFLAFYLHESNINKTPLQNWVDAQNLYLEKF